MSAGFFHLRFISPPASIVAPSPHDAFLRVGLLPLRPRAEKPRPHGTGFPARGFATHLGCLSDFLVRPLVRRPRLGADLRARIDAALGAVQLADRRREPVKNFSGGMARRLNLVAALLHRPKLLLCDEPAVGIDPQSRNAILDCLERLNREGPTVICSTHSMEEAARLCSRIGIIGPGKLLALGTLDELLARLPFEEEIRFPATSTTTPLAAELSSRGKLTTENDTHRFRPHIDFKLSAVFALAESHALPGRLFTSQRPTLEALFLHLTGRTLRE